VICVALFVAALLAGTARADDAMYENGPAIGDTVGLLDLLDPLGDLSIPDPLQTAYTSTGCDEDTYPCTAAPSSATCSSIPADDRTSGPIPSNAAQFEALYFVPSDRTPQAKMHRAAVCDDGSHREPAIGRAVRNSRVFPANQTSGQGARVSGQGFKFLSRTYSRYGYTNSFYDVMLVRGAHTESYYNVDPHTRIWEELEAKGWTNPSPKHVAFSDAREPNGYAGFGSYGGWRGSVFERYLRAGQTYNPRWGCADQGDAVVLHEFLHQYATVNPSANEYDADHAYHSQQSNDLMHYQTVTSYSGKASSGATIPVTQWDPGQDTYTGRVLSFPAYLQSISSRPYLTC
jgi:hypothetical protein